MIPKKINHIWIGPYLPPDEWMQTWTSSHPDWAYTVFDNRYLQNRRWRLQNHINEYMKRGAYSGVADIMRYEILLEQGGFIAPADSVCLNPVDDLFTEAKAYTVFENELVRGNLMMPFLASPPQNKAVAEMLNLIEAQPLETLGQAYLATGNYIVGKVARQFPDDVVLLPSYTFNPKHHVGINYTGTGKVYSDQFFATGGNLYKKNTGNPIRNLIEKYNAKKKKRQFKAADKRAQYLTYDDNDLHLLKNALK